MIVKSKLHKRALLLSYLTVGYNILEGVVSIAAGLISGSVALVGFGLDSFVESLSGSIMIWRFKAAVPKCDEEKIEKKAVMLVGYTFFILGAYVLYESIKKLYLNDIPEPSLLGIIIAITSMVAMPLLFYMKQKVAKSIKSRSLLADSKQTLACMFLSVALLFGLSLNYFFGFWQADPIVGLIIVFYLFKEGRDTLKEETLCSC